MTKRIVWTSQAIADVRGIEQPIAIQILRTLGRYVLTGEGATKQLQGVSPPLIGYEANKTEHSGAKRGNGAYWGYKWEAKTELPRS